MNALAATASPAAPASTVKRAGLIVAFAALLVITWLPGAAGLPPAGQVMLAILAFAVIVWMTEALDYAVSAVVIGALMIFLLAYVPDAAKPGSADMGTSAALGLALSGFSSSAVALVAAACFIAAAMTATGLDRRIALVVPSYIEALHVAARTDLVAFVPRRLIAALSKQLSLVTVSPPIDPGTDEQFMFYPTRAQMDPGSIWLRTIMLGIGREMERAKRKAE